MVQGNNKRQSEDLHTMAERMMACYCKRENKIEWNEMNDLEKNNKAQEEHVQEG